MEKQIHDHIVERNPMNPRYKRDDVPEMCSPEAYALGCICRLRPAWPTDISPPEPQRNRYCPVHSGYDPDYERDRKIDEKLERD